MKILFEKKFLKDVEALQGSELKQRIADVIKAAENAATLHDLPNLKKMKGHKSACIPHSYWRVPLRIFY